MHVAGRRRLALRGRSWGRPFVLLEGLSRAPRFIVLVCVLPSELTVLRTHRKHWGPPVCCTVLPGGRSGGKGAPQCGVWNLPCIAARTGPWSSLGGSPGGCERMLLAGLFSHSSSWMPPVCACLEHICKAGEGRGLRPRLEITGLLVSPGDLSRDTQGRRHLFPIAYCLLQIAV